MKSITLKDTITGETVTFNSQTEAVAHTHATHMCISKLARGIYKSVNCGRYVLAEEEDRHDLYWELYRAS